MSNPEQVVYHVCLQIDAMRSTYVETSDGDWLDNASDLASFRFKAAKKLKSEQLSAWFSTRLGINFDGELDQPSDILKIYNVQVSGPSFTENDNDGWALSEVSIYLDVVARPDMEEDNFDDLFHLIVPIISDNGETMGFSEFESYSSSFQEAPNSLRKLGTTWANLDHI